jgi:hypothetical protein
MKLFDELRDVVRHVETTLAVRLTDANFADAREELLHVFLHEACHAAVSNRVPWIHDLPEREHTALDEVMARLLETELAPRLNLHVHTIEEHARELEMYGLSVPVETLERLDATWRERHRKTWDLPGMAEAAREHLGVSSPSHEISR